MGTVPGTAGPSGFGTARAAPEVGTGTGLAFAIRSGVQYAALRSADMWLTVTPRP
ncbi:hypothetical protein [Actinophytocola algeriensis]|uniref:Uncharacterized protein n=1 Tax=Actinophytocola algeriensis TaxID=1768010 RepID=A0A7W7Q8Q8_9PSEU|nr:hypothetical protein [Actinophytocola algeriensis]MBB4909137.1 hypothetical protein [Actinophytocola algeriensis]MBE1474475.1 hypothetical protein [Actinophytocola algeriensis]